MNLRRVILALAVLSLFVGLASAQVVTPTPINCSVSATNQNLRAESVTERTGDVVITCTGGPTPTPGNAADRATVTIDFSGASITSRTGSSVAGPSGDSTGYNRSEALLLIDEPGGSGGPAGAFGQNAPAVVCDAVSAVQSTQGNASPLCPAYVGVVNGYYVVAGNSLPFVNNGQGNPAYITTNNAYQGVIPSANGANTKIIFFNVPVVPTGSSAVSRVYRLVNARVNTASNATITANVTVTPATNATITMNVTNNAVTAGTAAAGLITSVTTIGGSSLCLGTALNPTAGIQTKANTAILGFKEGFGNAFKTMVLPVTAAASPNVAGAAENAAQNQANATGSYTISSTLSLTTASSESGFIPLSSPGAAVAGFPTSSTVLGLANFGTRFKAVFKGLSSKATYYVSIHNVADYANEVAVPTNGAGDASQTPYAVLVGSGNSTSTNNAAEIATFAAVPANSPNANPTISNGAGVAVFQLAPDSNGNAEAIWEVTNVSTSVDSYNFAFYAVYSAVTNSPAQGNDGTVLLGFAPTNTVSGSGATTTHLPRFSAPASSGTTNVFIVVPCQTTLLFPFFTTVQQNVAGSLTNHWDTGISIMNTGADPYNSVVAPSPASTTTTCNLSFYTGSTTPLTITTAPVAPGNGFVALASDPSLTGASTNLGKTGYMFAVCNFQFAHGFAYITDPVGNAMGYLAEVVDNSSGITRNAPLTGEALKH